MASGTISAPETSGLGSLLERTEGGKKSFALADGSERTFLRDGDAVVMRAFSKKNGVRVGFGEVRGRVLPAI